MKTELEKMVAGELYNALDPEIVRRRERSRELQWALNATLETEQARRQEILRELLGAGGDSCWIQPPFFCDYGFNLYLGKKVYFNFNCVVLDVAPVHIGEHTLFGPAVQIYTATHPLNPHERRKKEFAKPIRIGHDCWIGGGAIILPGITVGDNTVIGSGSVVTKNLPSNVLAAGNPCRILRELTPEELTQPRDG